MSDVDTLVATSSTVTASSWWRWLLLVSVAVCAASGLVYELALLTLSTSLSGGGIVETSLIVAGYVAALGLGALAAKPLLHTPAKTFLLIEATLGLIGGSSALVLYIVFAAVGQSLVALIFSTLFIGMLVGAELPLLMTLIQQGRVIDAQGSGSLIATLNFADYLGALVGGLAWPFILLPWLGMVRGTIVAGMVNLAAALFIAIILLQHYLGRRDFITTITALIISASLLLGLFYFSEGIIHQSKQILYRDRIIYSQQSDYQDIVVTRNHKDQRLYLNGGLQYSSRDEYRYTESLVYPAITENTKNVLIIGGGDGLAARELIKMNLQVTQVELDPQVILVANTVLREDNNGSLQDPRVQVITEDAFTWLRQGKNPEKYDAVLVDLPDPDNAILARLYSEEFYALARNTLTEHGRMVVQASSAYSTPDVFWRVNSTLQAAGCPEVLPYHVHVPTFGDWGFALCAAEGTTLEVPPRAPTLRFATTEMLQAASVFGLDNQPRQLKPSTLDHPYIVDDLRKGYRQAGD